MKWATPATLLGVKETEALPIKINKICKNKNSNL